MLPGASLVLYQQKDDNLSFAIQNGAKVRTYLSLGEAITVVLSLIDPRLRRTFKEDAGWVRLDSITANILPTPSHLTEPAGMAISAHAAHSTALANAGHQPVAFPGKPFGIGPAVLVSDHTLMLLARCHVCHLGVINVFQESCGHASCPYFKPEKG